ncbi:YdbL family protein [Desulfococcus sp.]|uniref:YdbL family protein n=1 Tax=Desulfococcus sp. TaxID=2025834 RepID=UPI0035947094
MPSKRVTLLLTIIICHVLLIVAARGQDDVKSRMAARIPAIDALKARGVVGENSSGYLEFRGPAEKAEVVKAENADRSVLFAGIAAEQGTTAEIVGRRFAVKFRDLTRPGEWFQDDAGVWRRK